MEPLSANDPRTVGEFQLRARLGAGGMGRVYLGFSPAGRPVAVKLVHPELARDPEFIQRFAREVAAARMVSGVYTAQVVGAGLQDETPWLATMYVPGPSLAGLVAEYGPLPEDAVWRLGAGLAEALQAIHGCGLVHRDLKPANVLLAADGPHVIDFGISRALDGTGGLTATGIVLGTPGYMSPEQATGDPVGPPSDVFSLACVLAFAATGTQPFGDGTPAAVLYRIVSAEPDLRGVSPRLRDVLARCLDKDPSRRPSLPDLASAFSRGGQTVPESLSSFWPVAVAEVIRRSIPDISVTGGSATTGYATGGSAFTPPAYTPTASASYQPGPPPATYSPTESVYAQRPADPAGPAGPAAFGAGPVAPGTGQVAPGTGPVAPGTGMPGMAMSAAGPVYAGPSYGQLPPPGHVPGLVTPAPAAVPGDARVAGATMLVGAAVTMVNVAICLGARARLLRIAQEHPRLPVGVHAHAAAAQIAVYALLPYILGFFGWLASAAAAFRGRRGTPTAAAVLFGLGTITTLLILFHVHSQRRIDVLAIAIWALGLLAVFVLRSRTSRAFFQSR
jgi:serine/threonine protein kinase